MSAGSLTAHEAEALAWLSELCVSEAPDVQMVIARGLAARVERAEKAEAALVRISKLLDEYDFDARGERPHPMRGELRDLLDEHFAGQPSSSRHEAEERLRMWPTPPTSVLAISGDVQTSGYVTTDSPPCKTCGTIMCGDEETGRWWCPCCEGIRR